MTNNIFTDLMGLTDEQFAALSAQVTEEAKRAASQLLDEVVGRKRKESPEPDANEPIPFDEPSACTDCGCDECSMCGEPDCNDVPETVCLNADEFNKSSEPCDIVTIYARNLEENPDICVEYDKDMEPYGVVSALCEALAFAIHHMYAIEGHDIPLLHCKKVVSKKVGTMIYESAGIDPITAAIMNAMPI